MQECNSRLAPLSNEPVWGVGQEVLLRLAPKGTPVDFPRGVVALLATLELWNWTQVALGKRRPKVSWS